MGVRSWRDDSLTRLKRAGVIRVGYAIEAPYAFLTPDGEVTGEAPEIARQLASRLGIARVSWHQSELGSLVSGLEAGDFDVIAAGFFISPDRARRVAFSQPTFHVQEGLLVARGNPKDIHSYEQASTRADVRIAVVSGSVEERLLRRLGYKVLIAVPDAAGGCLAVASGQADGLALSSPSVEWMAGHDDARRIEPARPFRQPEASPIGRIGYGAFAFRKQDWKLRNAWNRALQAFVGTSEHRASFSRFGLSDAELPGAITTEELLER